MSDTIYLKVKNWERFQQYKDGRPLRWIKLYVKLLGDFEFDRLPETTQLHLVKLWLVAAENDNRIPCEPGWIARHIGAKSPVDLLTLIEDGWLGVHAPHDVENAVKYVREQDVRFRTEGEGGERTTHALARGEQRRVEESTGDSLPTVENTPGEDAAEDHTQEDRRALAGALRSEALLGQSGDVAERKMTTNMDISDTLHREGYEYARLEDAVRGARLMIQHREKSFRDWIDPDETFGMGIFRHDKEEGVKLIEVCASYWHKNAPVAVSA